MAETPQKPLLLALDGSERAFQTVRYISEIPSMRSMPVVLFSVFSRIPEPYWDLERQPHVGRRIAEVHAWAVEEEKRLKAYMEKARKHLLKAGFSPESVKILIHARESGIARDILKQAAKGCRAVVVGRKGMTHLRRIVLGSVSAKLLEGMHFTPLILVGKGARPGKVLIAVDGSEGSLRAVDFAAATLDGSSMEITLTHVVRASTRETIGEAEIVIGRFFDEAKEHLIAGGMRPTQISTQVITNVPSRAAAIVEEARKGGYGTIIAGRRGITKVEEFFLGRVTNKLIQMGKGLAVWVIN